jgi:hypothetical protein
VSVSPKDAATFDPSGYPRTYEVALGWKLFLIPSGILFTLAGIGGIVFLLHSLSNNTNRPVWAIVFLGVLSAAFAVLGAYAALSVLSYRVTLTADGIEVVEPFRRRRLLTREIQGLRTVRTQQGPPTIVLVPNDRKAKKLKISLVLNRDRAFEEWYARLTDLDHRDVHQSERQLAQTLYQDLLPHERSARIKRLRSVAKWLNGATFTLCIAALGLPDYGHLVTGTLLGLPWVAVWMVSRFQPLYRFGAKRNDAHPDLTAPLMIPGLVLAVRAMTDLHTLDWHAPLMLSVVGGLALSGFALRVDPWFRQQHWAALLMGLFVCAYGLELNALADSTVPSVYATQVLGKRVSHGKSSTYYLRVTAWGPISEDADVSVSAGRYQATRIGDRVCVFLGSGAFRIPWFQIRDCPDNLAVRVSPG